MGQRQHNSTTLTNPYKPVCPQAGHAFSCQSGNLVSHFKLIKSMIATYTQRICAALIGISICLSCSRPVAYFQRGPVNPSTTVNTQPVAMPMLNPAMAIPERLVTNTNTTTAQLEAYARNGEKPALKRTLNKRMNRVETLLASTHRTLVPTVNYATRKMNTVEGPTVKKMNESNNQQLAPSKPKRAMGNRIKLIGGLVLLLVGVVIMIAGPSLIFFLGLILALLGTVGIIVGLFGE